MTIRTTSRPTYVPSILLAVAALIELGHDLVLRRAWNEIEYGWVLGFGLAFGALWLTGAVGAALRTRWAWPVAMLASLALMAHGSVLRLGEAWMGAVYLVLGAASLVLLMLHARAYGFHLDPVERHSIHP